MTRTLPGLHTGTVDDYTDTTHEHFRFQPQGTLALMTNEPVLAEKLPREISSNPSEDELLERVDSHMAPWYVRWFRSKKSAVRDSARLFVGFNVNANNGDLIHKWNAGQVYQTAYLLRRKQLEDSGLPPAFSYYVGLGAFPGTKGVVISEKSAQIVFMNFGQSSKAFHRDMVSLSARIADRLHQESVMLELSDRDGIFRLDYVDSKRRLPVDETLDWLDEYKGEFDEEVIKIQ